MAGERRTCEKCNKSLDESMFYTYKDGTKTELCKKCLTLHIDNYDPETFLWLLEKLDVPYIPEEWNVLRDRAYEKDPTKMTGMSVFGKYLSKMKLNQWKNYRWADSEKLQSLNAKKTEEQIQQQKENEEDLKKRFESGEISEAQYKTLMTATSQYNDMKNGGFSYNPYEEQEPLIDLPDPAADLTHEDKIYLAMKWGREYKPNEWLELEKKYTEMRNSFDIKDSDTEGNLILICKTYLKLNQAINENDMETYNKLSRVYESLRKSAKFTAAQNKAESKDFVTTIGELVAICEKDGFIPRFPTDIPQDKVDITLKDMNNYLYKLVTQDLGFGQQIEDSIKKIQLQKEIQEEEDANFLEDAGHTAEIKDEDFETYFNQIEEQKKHDIEIQIKDEEVE